MNQRNTLISRLNEKSIPLGGHLKIKPVINGLFTLILLTTLLFILTGCKESTIDQVKNSTLEFDKTLTIGDALDYWEECDNKTWTEFETENKRQIVQFTCKNRLETYFEQLCEQSKKGFGSYRFNFNRARTYGEPNPCKGLNVSSIDPIIQFSINTDGTFQISYLGSTIKWSDGKTVEEPATLDFLKKIYANNPSTFYRNIIVADNVAAASSADIRFKDNYSKAK